MPESGPIPPEFCLAAFDYVLPEELIAQHPAHVRDESKLMVVPAGGGAIEHRTFKDIVELLRPGDLLVANNARVLRARFPVRRREGGRAEVLLLHPAAEPGCWEAMARPGKRVRRGDRLSLTSDCGIEIVDWASRGNRIVRFYGVDADTAMQRFGQVPLPPYIKTPPDNAADRYQTVYASRDGSVAAPTAGFHFTPQLLDALCARGVGWTTITLDVGAGTFRPVKTDDIREHAMHAERYEIGEEAVRLIRDARAQGGRIIAIGTTAVRALESAAQENGELAAGSGWTSIYIYPPFRFRVVDALVTNFHLPRSTLLMLVCAFAGYDAVMTAYREAVRERYRFYSFGDAMLLRRLD